MTATSSELTRAAANMSELTRLRGRVEHLERLSLAQSLENEQLADENERLRTANAALSAPRGIRAALARGWRD